MEDVVEFDGTVEVSWSTGSSLMFLALEVVAGSKVARVDGHWGVSAKVGVLDISSSLSFLIPLS